MNKYDQAAESILAAKRAAEDLYQLNESYREKLDILECHLRVIAKADDHDDIRVLLNRIDRMNELRRMAEVGSFMIRVQKVMSETYRRLP